MNARQENKVSMFFKVSTFFNTHLPTLAASAPILTTRVASFNADLNSIQTFDIQATEDITGAFIQKNLLRGNMGTKAVAIANALVSQALAVGDNLRAKKVKLFKTEITNVRDTEALYNANRVLEFAQASAALLVPYGVTAIKITELATAITAYKNLIQIPGDESAESQAAGEHVDMAIAKCDAHLLIIDGVMQAVAEQHSLLFLQYRADRAIDDETGGSPSTPPNFIVTLQPNIYTQILSMPYNPTQRFKAKNTGADVVQWALSTSNAAFSTPPTPLAAGAESNLLSSSLAPNGDSLLFLNPTTNPITVEVTIVDL